MVLCAYRARPICSLPCLAAAVPRQHPIAPLPSPATHRSAPFAPGAGPPLSSPTPFPIAIRTKCLLPHRLHSFPTAGALVASSAPAFGSANEPPFLCFFLQIGSASPCYISPHGFPVQFLPQPAAGAPPHHRPHCHQGCLYHWPNTVSPAPS
jgi:hypothetical protein